MNDDHIPRNYNYVPEEHKEVSQHPPQWSVVPEAPGIHPQNPDYQ